MLKSIGNKLSQAASWVRDHSEDLSTGLITVVSVLYVAALAGGTAKVFQDLSAGHTKGVVDEGLDLKIQSVTYVPVEDK